MRIPLFQIDAFAKAQFRGNPAAVCPLDSWLPASTLQAIAQENNLSETAFFVGRRDHYELRWFSPVAEVNLCGHATLASAFVLFEYLNAQASELVFITRSGPLRVTRDVALLRLDLPRMELLPWVVTEGLVEALGARPSLVLTAGDEKYMAVFERESDVVSLRPHMAAVAALDRPGLIVTAPGDACDFVSRFFVPRQGIPEDPVTGSAHCALTPYWAERLGKRRLHAFQRSARGGELFCEMADDRVYVSGHAVKYLEGFIEIPVPPPSA